MSTIASTNIKHPSSATNNITLASTGAVAVNGAMTGAGLDLITPTSIAYSGGTAAASGGQITFSGVSSISINGCFTSNYDNYLIIRRLTISTANQVILRLRASGTDITSGYYGRYFQFYTSFSSSTFTTYADYATVRTSVCDRFINVFTPFSSAATTMIGNGIDNDGATSMLGEQTISTYPPTTSFDGFTIQPNGAQTINETIRIYGYKNS